WLLLPRIADPGRAIPRRVRRFRQRPARAALAQFLVQRGHVQVGSAGGRSTGILLINIPDSFLQFIYSALHGLVVTGQGRFHEPVTGFQSSHVGIEFALAAGLGGRGAHFRFLGRLGFLGRRLGGWFRLAESTRLAPFPGGLFLGDIVVLIVAGKGDRDDERG